MSTNESSEVLTFANFQPGVHDVYDIGDGVIEEMSVAFGHVFEEKADVDTLGQLIGAVGSAKTLQDNITHVQEILGDNAVEIARDWVTRSGLLTPVERSFMTAEAPTEAPEVVVVTGGVRNWMMRRAELALTFEPPSVVLLAGGNRIMKETEGPDVTAGMTEFDYLKEVVKPMFKDARARAMEVDSRIGSGVMAATAHAIGIKGIHTVMVASNAGVGMQNAGQLRYAMRRKSKYSYGPEYDADGTEFFFATDAFPLGTGEEPAATHQNPLTALGIIARNAQELLRHQ